MFRFGSYPTLIPAPIIMVSSNQINAVVPVPPPAALVYTLSAPNAWIQIQERPDADRELISTNWFPVTMVPEVPGVFTFRRTGTRPGSGAQLQRHHGLLDQFREESGAEGIHLQFVRHRDGRPDGRLHDHGHR